MTDRQAEELLNIRKGHSSVVKLMFCLQAGFPATPISEGLISARTGKNPLELLLLVNVKHSGPHGLTRYKAASYVYPIFLAT